MGTVDSAVVNGQVLNSGTIQVDRSLTIGNTGLVFDTSTGTASIANGMSLSVNAGSTRLGTEAS
ncbi:MAG: hypothetical protein IPP41_04265 [Rhodocyclaceae bacterium]|nr:hypothetical protein [Rhodocyclaceae bacterium]